MLGLVGGALGGETPRASCFWLVSYSTLARSRAADLVLLLTGCASYWLLKLISHNVTLLPKQRGAPT